MRRVLFRWRGVTIWSYPAMLYAGLVAGAAVGNIAAHAAGRNAFRVFAATLILIPPSIAGARICYVAEHWGVYRKDQSRIWDRNEGGMTAYGGLVAGLLLSIPVLALFGLAPGEFWDVAAQTIMTALAITKIGCLLNGCCAGRAWQGWFAVNLPNARGEWRPRVPAQCLESSWAVAVLGAGCFLLRRMPFPGGVFLAVAVLYGGGRLALEFLREREPGRGRKVSSQAIWAVVVLGALAVLAIRWPA